MSDDLPDDKTPWFPSSCKPVHIGFYESHWLIGSQTRLRFWDGALWRTDGEICGEQNLRWRGRAHADLDYVVDENVSEDPAGSQTVPHFVLTAVANGATPAKAWREHLGLKQDEVAVRMGISRPGYAFLERKMRLSERSRVSLAVAFGISADQLDL